MYEVVEYYEGGYAEQVVFTAMTEAEARQWCDDHETHLGSDSDGEDGLFLRAPDGSEIWR